MNSLTIFFSVIIAFGILFSCRSKPREKSGAAANYGSPPGEGTVQLNSKPPGKVGADLSHDPAESSQVPANAIEYNRPSYKNLEKDLTDALARIPPPKTIEEYAAIEIPYHKMFIRRRDLLFSIPLSPQAEKDRNEAWDTLGFGENPSKSFLDGEQNKYAEKLLNRYLDSPQLEKLVIWETVRTRTSGPKRGDATGEILLRIEMAKLLFSALGIDRQELFAAVDLKTRAASSEAETKASRAEEEIERMHIEQSKVAEKILEEHWKLPP